MDHPLERPAIVEEAAEVLFVALEADLVTADLIRIDPVDRKCRCVSECSEIIM